MASKIHSHGSTKGYAEKPSQIHKKNNQIQALRKENFAQFSDRHSMRFQKRHMSKLSNRKFSKLEQVLNAFFAYLFLSNELLCKLRNIEDRATFIKRVDDKKRETHKTFVSNAPSRQEEPQFSTSLVERVTATLSILSTVGSISLKAIALGTFGPFSGLFFTNSVAAEDILDAPLKLPNLNQLKDALREGYDKFPYTFDTAIGKRRLEKVLNFFRNPSKSLEGSLEGKLKPTAIILNRCLEKHHELAKEHPIEAELYVRGSMIASKGALGYAIGAVPGLVFGVAQEVGGEALGAAAGWFAGESIKKYMNKYVGGLATYSIKLDPTLTEQEASVFAGGIICYFLTSYDVGSVKAGMAAHVFGSPPTIFSKYWEMTKTSLLVSSREESIETTEKRTFAESNVFSQPFPSTEEVTEIMKEGNVFSELFPKIEKDALGFFANEASDILKKDFEESRHIMKLEKDGAATREIEIRIERNRAGLDYQQSIGVFAGGWHMLSGFASLAGNDEDAQKIALAGQGIVMVVDSFHMLTTISDLTSLAGLAQAIPYVGIGIEGLALLVSATRNNEDIGEAIRQAIKPLFSLINEWFEHVDKRFDGVMENLDTIHRDVLLGFMHLAKLEEDNHVVISYKLDSIQRYLEVINDLINPKLDLMLANEPIKSCAAIDSYETLYGPLKTMEKKEVKRHYKIFRNTLLGIYPYHSSMNGYSCRDFTPPFINKMCEIPLDSSLGYFLNYAKHELNETLPGDPKTVPNLSLWVNSSKRYRTLREARPDIPYDDKCDDLKTVMKEGKNALELIEYAETGRSLFKKLFTNHGTSIEQVRTVRSQIIEEMFQEIFETVYARAIDLNRESLATFPDYQALKPTPWGRTNSEEPWNSILKSRYLEIKPSLGRTLAEHFGDKKRFRVSVENSQTGVVLSVNKTPLMAFVLPGPLAEQVADFAYIPLEYWKIAPKIERYIPDFAFDAEALDIGILYPQYLTTYQAALPLQGANSKYPMTYQERENSNLAIDKRCGRACGFMPTEDDLFSIQIFFKINNESKPLSLGTVRLSGKCTSSLADLRDDHLASRLEIKFNFAYSLSPHRLRSVWENAKVINWEPSPEGQATLLTLVTKKRKEIFREVVTPKSGTDSHRVVEALQSSYNLLKRFCVMAGFPESEIDGILNKEILGSHLDGYPIPKDFSEELALIPKESVENFRKISSKIFSRFDHAPEENPFTEDLRREISELGQLTITLPEKVKMRKKSDSQKETTEIDLLRAELTEMKEMMKQLLAQKNGLKG